MDRVANTDATHSVVLSSQGGTLETTGKSIVEQVGALLDRRKLDAIVNVAGGWAGGNMSDDGTHDVFK